ncbi:hypothetical protein [Lyngbya confervoides]|uniref:Glycosyltransferase RgtA/B/C/D-like domain-containing protein n=1 Tax=Lyngbya confervoides BDU141951 TaxID=1574623 RepID=A0ABD4SZK2_9CYAN|nr:hypothetical protein [Lyngbya confervoides]MCM1981719.1 hypothetical protein [Lyngbya confervoides BDU141951]
MNSFSFFAILYMISYLLDQMETWDQGFSTFAGIALVIAILVRGFKRFDFFIFLLITTAEILIYRFPNLSNHGNVFLFCNVLLMTGMVYSWIRPARYPTDQSYYEMIGPPLRITLITTYFFAGFHKLNQDFFNPQVSCAGEFILQRMNLMLSSQIWGIPTSTVLGLGLLLITYLFYRASPVSLAHLIEPRYRRQLLGVIAPLMIGLFVLIAVPILSMTVPAVLVISTAVMIILWECLGAAGLCVPRAQLYVVVFSWLMHLILSLIGFVDFSSFATALLFTFIPAPYSQRLLKSQPISLLNWRIHRIHLYVLLTLLDGGIMGIHHQIQPLFAYHRVVSGLLFIGASLQLFWPVLQILVQTEAPPAWQGVPLWNARTPKFLLIFSLVLIVFGLSPYLGLRTAGTFTMFSNLRTEGPRSNHLLLATNPLKVWGYQEDLVKVLEMNPDFARDSRRFQDLEGNFLPVVEFQKLIHRYGMQDEGFPLWTFEYEGKRYHDIDLPNSPLWPTKAPSWEMTWMEFRLVQAEGANLCRW